jgi:ABC-2 type transport system ATP-binding protein
MRDLRDSGTTILFVSHNLGTVKNFCSEAILLHRGELVAAGDTSETIDRYQALLSSIEAQRGIQVGEGGPVSYNVEEEEETPTFKEDPGLERRRSRLRHGTGEARISNVEILDEYGEPTNIVSPESTITVRVHLRYEKAVKASTLGITLRNGAGLDVFATDTGLENVPLYDLHAGERVIIDFTLKTPLQQGPYSLAAAVSDPWNRTIYLDWVDVATVFEILPPMGRWATRGLVHLPTRVEVHRPDGEQGGRSA